MSDSATDEVDLLELIQILWDGKWIIAAISILFGLLAVIFVKLLPPNYRAELPVRPLDPQQMSAFATLNDIPGISNPVYADGGLVGQTGVILSAQLLQGFKDQFLSKEQLRKAIKEHDPAFGALDGAPADIAESLNRMAEKYQLEESENNSDSLILTIEAKDKTVARKILTYVTQDITDDLRRANLTAIANLKRSISTSLASESKRIKAQIAHSREIYDIETKAHLSFLREQAAIAHDLGVAESHIGLVRGTSSDDIGVSGGTKTPFYWRGYKAIEKEISQIEARSDGDITPYIDTYAALSAELYTLQADNRLEWIDAGVALTPLANPNTFQAVNLEIDNLIFKTTRNTMLAGILAIVLGGILSIIIVLLRHYMPKTTSTQT